MNIQEERARRIGIRKIGVILYHYGGPSLTSQVVEASEGADSDRISV